MCQYVHIFPKYSHICGTKQQLKQETHLCHSILDLGQDKATARYGYHSYENEIGVSYIFMVSTHTVIRPPIQLLE